MLTIDRCYSTPGKRERDLRNGHGRPMELKLKTALNGLTKPKWMHRFLTSRQLKMANMIHHLPYGDDMLKHSDSRYVKKIIILIDFNRDVI